MVAFYALTLDLTVTLGNILEIVVLIAALQLAYAALRERLVRIETQVKPLWDEYNTRRKAE